MRQLSGRVTASNSLETVVARASFQVIVSFFRNKSAAWLCEQLHPMSQCYVTRVQFQQTGYGSLSPRLFDQH